MVFSANLQETLGISWYEGALVGALPLVPDRLSYSEMAIHEFKYPSEWTKNFDTYKKFKPELVNKITEMMTNYKEYRKPLEKQMLQLKKFFHGERLYGSIK